MTPASSGLTALLCGLLIGFSGCGQSEPANSLMSDNDTLLNELLGSSESESDRSEEDSGSSAAADTDLAVSTVSSGLEIPSTENDTSDSIVDDILGSRSDDSTSDSVTTALLGNSRPQPFRSANSNSKQAVQLRAGDQFPFLKTVRQTVVQTTKTSGQSTEDQLTAQTLMQLTLNLSVLDSSAAGHVLQVQYDRVQYFQDVNGLQTRYDSAVQSPIGGQANQVPAGIETYVGMVGAGFRFNLTPDNTVSGTEGLSAFLDQCVSATPFEQRAAMRAALEQRFQSHAVAELVDESIALLPYGASVLKPGDVWVTDRQLQQQSPIQIQTTWRLLSTSSTVAKIGLTGRMESSPGAEFNISDGRTMGSCLVDLATGMPVHSQRSSYLKISSQPTLQQSVEITKRIESTFTSQNQSAKMMVQNHESMAQPIGASPAYGQAMGSPLNAVQNVAPNQSALLPPGGQRGYGMDPNAIRNPSLQVQPVSSANPYGGSLGSSHLQIPNDGAESIPTENLRSTAEAVYPD